MAVGSSSLLSLVLSNCTSTPTPPAEQPTTKSEYEADYEDEDEKDGEEDGEETADVEKNSGDSFFRVDSYGLPHPRLANAFETNRMIMISTERPSDSELGVCASDLAAMGRTSQNGDALIQSRDLLTAAVAKNPAYYHWCFYRYMASLDQGLSGNLQKLEFQKRYEEFLVTMKTLWILARALDKHRNWDKYFNYLRVRYLSLSKTHFARKLDVITGPLGDPRAPVNLSPGKPAGELAH